MWWISPNEYRSWMFSGLRSLGGTEYWLHDLWTCDSQSDNSSFMLRNRSKTRKKVRRWWTCFPRGLESKVRLNWCSNYHHWLYKTWTLYLWCHPQVSEELLWSSVWLSWLHPAGKQVEHRILNRSVSTTNRTTSRLIWYLHLKFCKKAPTPQTQPRSSVTWISWGDADR